MSLHELQTEWSIDDIDLANLLLDAEHDAVDRRRRQLEEERNDGR